MSFKKTISLFYFQFWSDVSLVDFEKLAAPATPVMNISFQVGDHGDDLNFDGPDGTLAHAYYPTSHPLGGDTHYDDDEIFTFNSTACKSAFTV